MTRARRTSLAIFLLLLAPACGRNEESNADEPLLIGSTTHDFGAIEVAAVQTIRHHRFLLTNASAAPIVVERLVPTCGCLTATVESSIVPVGGELRVDVSVFAQRPGAIAQSVHIVADGKVLATLDVRATGVVDSDGLDAHHLAKSIDGSHRLLLTMRTRTCSPPSPPWTHGVEGASVDVDPWELVFHTEDSWRWQAVVRVAVPLCEPSESIWLHCESSSTIVKAWWR